MTPASSATAPSDSTPQMIELLRKAGVTGLEDAGRNETALAKSSENSTSKSSQPRPPKDAGVTPKSSPQPTHVAVNPCQEPPPRKRVAFVESEEKGERQLLNPSELKNRPYSPITPRHGPDPVRIAGILRDEEQHKSPIVPTDESPDDAALRREMLQYAFSEVGAVVAELEL